MRFGAIAALAGDDGADELGDGTAGLAAALAPELPIRRREKAAWARREGARFGALVPMAVMLPPREEEGEEAAEWEAGRAEGCPRPIGAEDGEEVERGGIDRATDEVACVCMRTAHEIDQTVGEKGEDAPDHCLQRLLLPAGCCSK